MNYTRLSYRLSISGLSRIVVLIIGLMLLTNCQSAAPVSKPVPTQLPIQLLTPVPATRLPGTSVPVHLEFITSRRLIRVESVVGTLDSLGLPRNAAAFWVDSGSLLAGNRSIIFGFTDSPVFDILATLKIDENVIVTDQSGYRELYNVATQAQMATLDDAIQSNTKSNSIALIGVPLADGQIQVITLIPVYR